MRTIGSMIAFLVIAYQREWIGLVAVGLERLRDELACL